MIMRLLLITIFLTSPAYVNAAERFILDFKLLQENKPVESGKFFVTQKQHVWSKGLKRSYLTSRCEKLASGKTSKSLTLATHFSGMQITHQLEGNKINLTVVRNVVQPRLTEIRALGKDECKDISPDVSTVSQNYSLPATPGMNDSQIFGKDITLHIKLHLLASSSKQ